jgi:uncharacterized protein YgiM (DUF1202 family)
MKRHLSMIITSVAVLVALIGLSLGPVGRASADYGPTGTVNTGALNIRSGPGITYGVITSVYRGTTFTLLARNTDASWVKIVLSNGTQGWVNSRYITTTYPLYSLPVEGGVTAGNATVNTGALNIRSGPGITYGVITSVYRGTSLTLLARNADASWVKVALSSGTQGWVNSRYITKTYPLYSLPVEGGVTPPPPTTRTHVVQPGENLFRIALRYGVNMYTLAAVNGITNLSYIYAGQVLIIP